MKMFFGFSYVFTIGLVLLSFSIGIRSAPVIGYRPDPSAPPLKDSDNTSMTWHCNGVPKLMNIEINEDGKIKENTSEGWNYYKTVDWGDQWDKTELTYSVHNYADFPEDKVDEVLRRALAKWSGAAPRLKFTQLSNNSRTADMKLQFIRTIGSTDYSRVLAHSPFPKVDHPMEFIQGAGWTVDRYYGISAVVVATHEFGHALGVDHSEYPAAIMYPTPLMHGRPYFELHEDDVAAIQYLYPNGDSSSNVNEGQELDETSNQNSGEVSSDEKTGETSDQDEYEYVESWRTRREWRRNRSFTKRVANKLRDFFF